MYVVLKIASIRTTVSAVYIATQEKLLLHACALCVERVLYESGGQVSTEPFENKPRDTWPTSITYCSFKQQTTN